jgi:protein-disulfide isomerase
MSKIRKRNIVALGLVGVATLALGGVSLYYRGLDKVSDTVYPVTPRDNDIVYGDASAPYTLLALVSLGCPHCRRWEDEEMPKFIKQMVDTKKARLIIRDFPLDNQSLRGEAFLSCVVASKREAMRGPWYRDTGKFLVSVAMGEYGPEVVKAGNCMEDQGLLERFAKQADLDEKTYNVTGTPTFVLGNKTFTGERTAEQLIANMP